MSALPSLCLFSLGRFWGVFLPFLSGERVSFECAAAAKPTALPHSTHSSTVRWLGGLYSLSAPAVRPRFILHLTFPLLSSVMAFALAMTVPLFACCMCLAHHSKVVNAIKYRVHEASETVVQVLY